MSEYVWQSKVSRRTKYKQRQDEKVEQAKEEEEFLKTIHADVEPLPFTVVNGECEERVEVPEGCAGIIIGKKGERLKSIQEKLKVSIKIDGDKKVGCQTVIIRGKSYEDVVAAVREVDFASEVIDVPRHMVGWVCGKGNRHLRLIREMTGVAVLTMRDDGNNGDDSVPVTSAEDDDGHCWLEIRGTRKTVVDARLCLDAHINYFPVFEEMGRVEADLDRQLAEANAELGRRPGQSNREGGPSSAVTVNAVASTSAAALGEMRTDRGRGRGRQPRRDAANHAEAEHENGNSDEPINADTGRPGVLRSRGRGRGRDRGSVRELGIDAELAEEPVPGDDARPGKGVNSIGRGSGGRRGAGRGGRSDRGPVGMGGRGRNQG